MPCAQEFANCMMILLVMLLQLQLLNMNKTSLTHLPTTILCLVISRRMETFTIKRVTAQIAKLATCILLIKMAVNFMQSGWIIRYTIGRFIK